MRNGKSGNTLMPLARWSPSASRAPGICLSRSKLVDKANDIQHGGTHYKGKPIQPWDYIAANGIGFFEGNAIKYLTRWREKGGIEDLEKARHYIDKLIEVENSPK